MKNGFELEFEIFSLFDFRKMVSYKSLAVRQVTNSPKHMTVN